MDDTEGRGFVKREATEHPKLVELVDALEQLDVPHARAIAKGVLEGLWHFTARYAPAGNVGRFGDKAIAHACGWDGDPAILVAALLGPGDGDGSGWIDRHPDHRLVVHDWSDHADDAVHRQLARRVEHFCDGTRPNLRRFGESERNRLSGEFQRLEESAQSAPIDAHAGRTPGARRAPCLSPAPPEPRLSPAKEEEKDPPPSAAIARCGPTAVPNALTPEESESLATWASEHHPDLTPADLDRAWDAVRDWALSNGKRKRDWLATTRNAIRDGWALGRRGEGGGDAKAVEARRAALVREFG